MQRLGCRRFVDELTQHSSQHHARCFTTTSERRSRTRRLRGEPQRDKPVEFYTIPPVVLDLDAEGSSNVRSCNEQDEQEQREKWSQNPQVDELVRRVTGFRKGLPKKAALWYKRMPVFDARRFTNRDVLSVAFLGWPPQQTEASNPLEQPEDASETSKHPGIGSLSSEIFHSLGVSDRLTKDDRSTLALVLNRIQHRQQTPATHALEDDLGKALVAHDFEHASRILAPLLGSSRGCQLVNQCGSELLLVCSQDEGLSDPDRSMRALRFLRNIAINLATKNIKPDGFGSPFGPFGQALLGPQLASDALRLRMVGTLLDASSHATLPATLGRADVLELMLTSGRFSGAPDSSFRDVICGNGDLSDYTTYILALGKSGALRTLWHEWHTSKKFRWSSADERLQPFAKAVQSALAFLRKHASVEQVLVESTGEFSQDAALDIGSVRAAETQQMETKDLKSGSQLEFLDWEHDLLEIKGALSSATVSEYSSQLLAPVTQPQRAEQ